jgi:S1-C subfamily serine protease
VPFSSHNFRGLLTSVKNRSGSWTGVVLASAALSAGCVEEDAAQAAFASDFHCPQAVVRETQAAGRFRAHGCGRTATYICQGTVCTLQVVEEERGALATRGELRARSPRPTTSQSLASNRKSAPAAEGGTMRLDLDLDEKALLRLSAAPDKVENLVQLKLIRQEAIEDIDECNLDFMVNGQVLATPKAVATRQGELLSHRLQITRDVVGAFATADKISLRACKERWALTREQVEKVRGFMDRFEEEIAWKTPASAGSLAAMPAPSGGWPSWTAPTKPLPTSATGPALDPPALFKKLSVSVFQLEAARGADTAQGSAVAVSNSELVTNCHVVQGATKLTLKQGKQQWPSSVVRADPASDRCIIAVSGVKLQPVVGLRAYESVEVGEAVYTLGSPVGLQLTLSSGLVSGRREELGRNYIQTTAPISPGSSGGGLFDARGNLLGITTLVMVGREHLNQSLNFAIPADTFWQP